MAERTTRIWLHPDDLVPRPDETVREMGAEKAGDAGDQNAHQLRPTES